MRIYKNRFYLCREHLGLSRFKQWDKWEYYITTGHKACNDRTRVVSEYSRGRYDIFRLEDGHLPDYQPHANEAEALQWLGVNLYQRITPIEVE